MRQVNRVNYGLLAGPPPADNDDDGISEAEAGSRSRYHTAVPFLGKDKPSKAAEYANPEVLIGLTLLAFRHEGLRSWETEKIVRAMLSTLKSEHEANKNITGRPACADFGCSEMNRNVLRLCSAQVANISFITIAFSLVCRMPNLQRLR